VLVMRWFAYVQKILLFIAIGSNPFAQDFPASTGSCGVSANSTEGCNWTSGITLGQNDQSREVRLQLFTTTYVLAPGAPLSTPVERNDNVVVALTDVTLRNERKTPTDEFSVRQNEVFLMPHHERYVLRNVGAHNATLLVIELRSAEKAKR
jgi:hypothetical protein